MTLEIEALALVMHKTVAVFVVIVVNVNDRLNSSGLL
jgi:hypothetical protein